MPRSILLHCAAGREAMMINPKPRKDMSAPPPEHGKGADQGMPPSLAGGIVAGVMLFNAIVGRRNAPDPTHPAIRGWYKSLRKPNFTPPDPLFGAVWPVLEASFAVGGYRLLRAPPSPGRDASAGLWLITTGLIGGWAEIFFRHHALARSAILSGVMLATASAYVASTHKVDRVAQGTAVPLVGWLGFATLLAVRIWQLNPAPRATDYRRNNVSS